MRSSYFRRVMRDRRVAIALALTVAACASDPSETASESGTLPDSATALVADFDPREALGPATDLPANELGQIMVLEYHRVGEPEGEFKRTLANFRADLERLYAGGYRPITMREVLEGDIDVPSGTTPVVFTFDDSTQGQFYLLDDGSIDPNTMVGVWDQFRRDNPGWDGGATWCVLPAADHPSNFFGELPSREVPREVREQRIRQKIDYLVQNGHEICNHTLYHARLDRGDDAQVQEWIGRGADSIKVYLPADYEIKTLALPLGMWPKTKSLAYRGSWSGREYRYEGVLEVSGGPAVSPFHRDFDPLSIPRLIVAPNHLERQLAAYEQNPARRFISDGDPAIVSVPESRAAEVNQQRIGNRPVRTVPDYAPPAQPSPSATGAAASPEQPNAPARPRAGEGT